MGEARRQGRRTRVRSALLHLALAGAVALAGLVPRARAILVDLEPRVIPLLVIVALVGGLGARLAGGLGGRARARPARRFERRLGRGLARWAWAAAVLAWLLPLWSQLDGRPPDRVAAWQVPLGRIPWSDGHGYFGGAQQLLAEGRFGHFAEQKPIFPALLAVGLVVARGSLTAVLSATSVLLGLASFLAAREIGLRYGLWCALAAFAMLLGLGRGVSVAVVTESPGIVFGALALAVLVSARARRRAGWSAAGLFLLAVAMQVRPGAQFVLLALAVWMGWHFRARRGQALAWAGAALVAATLVTSLLGRAYGAGESSFYARPAFVAYGLVRGTNEVQAFIDFASRRDEFATEGEFARFVYGEALSEFRRQPWVLVRSSAAAMGHLVEKNAKALFAVVNVTHLAADENDRFTGRGVVAWPGKLLVAMLAALAAARAWQGRERGFWLAVLAGTLASGAFVGRENPVHGVAAVHPLIALGMSLGLATGRVPRRLLPGSAAAAAEARALRAALGVGAALVVAALVGPLWAREAWPRPTAAMLTGKEAGRDVVIARETSPTVAVGPRAMPFRRYRALIELSGTAMNVVEPPPPFVLLSGWDFVARRQRLVYAPVEVAGATGFLHLVLEDERAAPNQQLVARASSWRPLGAWK